MAKKEQKISLNLKIIGRVQGVGYRAWAERQAQALGLTGWVRNTAEGDVELQAHGEKEVLEKLLELCWRGPAASKVSEIKTNWQEKSEKYSGFSIRY